MLDVERQQNNIFKMREDKGHLRIPYLDKLSSKNVF